MKDFLWILCLTALALTVVSQINDELDWDGTLPDLAAPLTLRCCSQMSDTSVDPLYECLDEAIYLNRLLRTAADARPRVSMYTYVTEGIANYAAYSTFANALYAEQNHYSFHVLGREKAHSLQGYSPERLDPYAGSSDPRWNKVHILLRALQNEPDPDLDIADMTDGGGDGDEGRENRPSGGSDAGAGAEEAKGQGQGQGQGQPYTNPRKRRPSSYVAWLDADLIILDLDMRIEAIGEMYPDADLIMSRDVSHAEFVSNTGFIIARRSAWSIAFFQKWWSAYDRTRCCDQNAFTWLYDRFNQENLGHVKLLRADAMNSHFPAWKNQKDYNQVLHLAGASSLYRGPIFKGAMEDLCCSGYQQSRNLHARIIRERQERLEREQGTGGVASALAGLLPRWLKPAAANSKDAGEGQADDAESRQLKDWQEAERARLHPQYGLNAAVLMQFVIKLGASRVKSLEQLSVLKSENPIIGANRRTISMAIYTNGVPGAFGRSIGERAHNADGGYRGDGDDDAGDEINSGNDNEEDGSAPLPLEAHTLQSLSHADAHKVIPIWLHDAALAGKYIQHFQYTLADVLKIDHDDTWTLMEHARARTAEAMGTEQPSSIENRLLCNIRAWLLANYRSIALDLAEILLYMDSFPDYRLSQLELDSIDSLLIIIEGGISLSRPSSVVLDDDGDELSTAVGLGQTGKTSQVDGVSVPASLDLSEETVMQTVAYTKLKRLTLEFLKESVSRAFELVLDLEQNENHSGGGGSLSSANYALQRYILADVSDNLLASMSTYAPDALVGKALYYRFKKEQLLASTYTNDQVSDNQQDKRALYRGIDALKKAVHFWRKMSERNYYGSDYVMADPYKEGSEVLSTVGNLQCMVGKFSDGIESLEECAELQDRTLTGYQAIRIATRKDIFQGQIALATTLVSLGICQLDRYNADEAAARKRKAAALTRAERLLSEAARGGAGDSPEANGERHRDDAEFDSDNADADDGVASGGKSGGVPLKLKGVHDALLYLERARAIVSTVAAHNADRSEDVSILSERADHFHRKALSILDKGLSGGLVSALSTSGEGGSPSDGRALEALSPPSPLQDPSRNLCIKDSCLRLLHNQAHIATTGAPNPILESNVIAMTGFLRGVKYTFTDDDGIRELRADDPEDQPVLIVDEAGGKRDSDKGGGFNQIRQISGKQAGVDPLIVRLDVPSANAGAGAGAGADRNEAAAPKFKTMFRKKKPKGGS